MGLVSAVLVLGAFFAVLLAAGWRPGADTSPGSPLHHAYLQATTATFAGTAALPGWAGPDAAVPGRCLGRRRALPLDRAARPNARSRDCELSPSPRRLKKQSDTSAGTC
jgi:hypothetical protein